MDDLGNLFRAFTMHEWIFESKTSDQFLSLMTSEDKADFPFDPRTIDWPKFMHRHCYGIRRFYLKEDCLDPHDAWKQIVMKQTWSWTADASMALRKFPDGYFSGKDSKKFSGAVLSKERFQEYMQMAGRK